MTVTTAHAPSRLRHSGAEHGDEPSKDSHLWRAVAAKVLLPALLVMALLAALVYSVFPTRTWLDQLAQITELETRLVAIEEANQALEARKVTLSTEAEIERIARQDHGLVRPGEEAYAVLPPAPEAVRLPQAWPFTELARALDS